MDLDTPLNDSGWYGNWNITQMFHHTDFFKEVH